MNLRAVNEETQDIISELYALPAWKGFLSGLEAEEFLKGQSQFAYVLREGEVVNNFYISYVGNEGVIRHQPFKITITYGGWFLQNGSVTGPFLNVPIESILPRLMH